MHLDEAKVFSRGGGLPPVTSADLFNWPKRAVQDDVEHGGEKMGLHRRPPGKPPDSSTASSLSLVLF
jgi:hypothetical protein